MRRLLSVLLVSFAFLFGANARAQDVQVSAVTDLEIQFWPDYDRPAVLVLLTGTLPSPGTVSLPFPQDGEFLVLARIDSANNMIDDIGRPTLANGLATFTLPAPDVRFRLEYYLPYRVAGNTRSFNYSWQSDLAVNQVIMRVQQPAAATSLTTLPAATGQVISQSDGLTYHTLPPQAAPAGQPLTLQVNYTMAADTLSVNSLPTGSALLPGGTGGNTAVSPGNPVNWWLIGGGLLLVIGAGLLTWQLALRRNGRKARKPAPRRPRPATKATPAAPKSSRPLESASPQTRPQTRPAASAPQQQQTRFCHECGQQAQPGDRFCRNCGTALR